LSKNTARLQQLGVILDPDWLLFLLLILGVGQKPAGDRKDSALRI